MSTSIDFLSLEDAENVVGNKLGMFFVAHTYAVLIGTNADSMDSVNGTDTVHMAGVYPQLETSSTAKLSRNSQYCVFIRLFERDSTTSPWREITDQFVTKNWSNCYCTTIQLPDVLRLVRDGKMEVLKECLKFGG